MSIHTAHAASPLHRPKLVPAFTVEKIDGEHEVTLYSMEKISERKDKNGNYKYRLVSEKESRPNGWLVRFPSGHSVHIATYEALHAAGFTRTETPVVDDEGDVVATLPNQVQKPSGKGVTANA